MLNEVQNILSLVQILASIVTIAVAVIIWFPSRQTEKALENAEKALENSENAQFSTLFNDLGDEHTLNLQKKHDLDKIQDDGELFTACDLHVLSYCDFMDRLAYLALKKKIPNEIPLKFSSYFEYVQLIMKWYDDVIVKNPKEQILRSSIDRWSSIKQ